MRRFFGQEPGLRERRANVFQERRESAMKLLQFPE
jgi:hypothetical protein